MALIRVERRLAAIFLYVACNQPRTVSAIAALTYTFHLRSRVVIVRQLGEVENSCKIHRITGFLDISIFRYSRD
jgi:hypothetical protein